MSIRQSIGGLLKLAVVVACGYGIWVWQGGASSGDDVREFARRACADEVRARYNVSNVRSYDIDENANGFVVRVTVTLPRGDAAKVVCLTNRNGGVRDLTIEER
jgi:hypothetical protein